MMRSLSFAPAYGQNAVEGGLELLNKILDENKFWETTIKEIGEHKNYKDSVKDKLPVIFWNVSRFGDKPKGGAKTNHTEGNVVESSGLFMTDFDGRANKSVTDWGQYYADHIQGREEQEGILFARLVVTGCTQWPFFPKECPFRMLSSFRPSAWGSTMMHLARTYRAAPMQFPVSMSCMTEWRSGSREPK